jgi:hypothetical protein
MIDYALAIARKIIKRLLLPIRCQSVAWEFCQKWGIPEFSLFFAKKIKKLW